MQRTKWTERQFTFDLPEGWIFNILERLRGTPARIVELTLSLSKDELTFKPDGKWSIQEHIGHLADLEELHEGRIDDFLAGKEVLRAADMSNAKTETANHNEKDIHRLLENFRIARNHFIRRLASLDDETYRYNSLHPRLKVFMRPIDIAFFTAEHDDHHLASMRANLEKR